MEQLFEEYQELAMRNQEELNDDASITHLLYIEGFKYHDVEKIKKINKIAETKKNKRIRLVQDFGMLRKKVDEIDHSNSKQLLKDIDMHINSIMFEIDKLEHLQQKSFRFLKTTQSQPQIKPPQTAPLPDVQQATSTSNKFYQSNQNLSNTGSTFYKSSFQFYRAQRDQQIQSHNRKWIEKQYQISQKQVLDELEFQRFKSEIEEKQRHAEHNLSEYQAWQQRQLDKQEQQNSQRLQLHKDRVSKDSEQRLKRLQDKLHNKEQKLIKQKQLLQDYNEEVKQQKQTQFNRIKLQSQQAEFAKSQSNMSKMNQIEEKEKKNEKKRIYIEEQRNWIQNQLKQQADIKQGKIIKAAQIIQQQDEERRRKFDEKEKKHLEYQNKYNKLYDEYQNQLIKDKEQKIEKTLLRKAFQDAGEQKYAIFQHNLRANSQAEAQQLKERRVRIGQEFKAADTLLKQLEINERLQKIEEDFERKRQQQIDKEEYLYQRQLEIENDQKQVIRQREIQTRKLEIEKEQKTKERLSLSQSKFRESQQTIKQE